MGRACARAGVSQTFVRKARPHCLAGPVALGTGHARIQSPSSRATSPRWPLTPLSTRPTNRCSAAAAWTAPFIARRGPELLAECRKLGGCPTGQAKLTRGYQLPAKYVIHTVGPVWRGGAAGEPDLLAACYRSSLQLAAEKGLATVAFPSVSTGLYGYPIALACRIALRTTKVFSGAPHAAAPRDVCLLYRRTTSTNTGSRWRRS